MTLVDWIVLIILVCAVVGGLMQGFFRSVCALGGLILGLMLAAWNYGRLALLLLPVVRIPAVADTIAFLLIALLVMIVIGLIGNLIARAMRLIGLGWLDALAGGVFGFFQGVLLIVLGILVVVAFFPQEQWIAEARFPRIFFGACHMSANVTPAELSQRIRSGLKQWESQSPRWMHPDRSS